MFVANGTRAEKPSSLQQHKKNGSYRDSKGSPFTRMPPKRTSLSTIKVALAIARGDGVEVDENTQKKLIMLDEETPVKPFKRLPLVRKVPVKMPPALVNRTTIPFLDLESASSRITPLSASSSEESTSYLSQRNTSGENMKPNEWEFTIDESDPWEVAANKDSAPSLPTRTRDDYGC
jgi:hypothetical protein